MGYIPYKTRRRLAKKRKLPIGRRIFLTCNAIFLGIYAFICLVPFINLLAISLSSNTAVDSGTVGLIPVDFTLQAYGYLLKKQEFFRAFGWSVLRVVLGTAISLAVVILAAYPLSKGTKQFKGRKFYVAFFILIMFFSGGLVPTFLLIVNLGLYNTIWALVLPTAMNAWNMVLMINFFRQVPVALEEAAKMEGASDFRILVSIYLPLSLPAIATVALFTAVQHWNSWFDGLIYMDPSKFPLQSYIYNMINEVNTILQSNNVSEEQMALLESLPQKTLRSAQIFIAMLPIMIVYPFAQKFFIKGLVMGGVKE